MSNICNHIENNTYNYTMGNRINYTKGQILGNNITFIEEVGMNKHQKLIALFKCFCGNEFSCVASAVKGGNTKSCGCHNMFIRIKNNKLKITHGDSNNTSKHYYLYYTWRSIKSRCYNKNNKSFMHYGGRGITMYELWFNNYILFKDYFLTNLGERPDGYSLDRINNNGNYEPNNLRWASASEQQLNKRNK